MGAPRGTSDARLPIGRARGAAERSGGLRPGAEWLFPLTYVAHLAEGREALRLTRDAWWAGIAAGIAVNAAIVVFLASGA